ncbi:carbohydrate ABC transporter permease [Treponema sp. TIM-1]|uniref:carbohydrate ABC transporter permease n=1 Tax=Treponema sp. TIM-1 TaxID=2898417 RepID=UPI0039800B7D
MRKHTNAITFVLAVLKYAFLILMAAISLGPLLWAFISSFKSYAEINSSALSFPSVLRFKNYADAFKYAPIGEFFLNSIIIVCSSIILTLFCVCPCAYVVSRFKFKAGAIIVFFISVALLLPAQALSQPLFTLLNALSIFDTKRGLIFVYSAFGIPITFFIMASYYRTIPKEMEEAAYIDGAGFFRTFGSMVLPLAKPGIMTAAILQFINTWNEFYFALILTSGKTARTIPIALNYYLGTFANNYAALFAAVMMTVLPTIVVFIIAQDQVTESLTAGAVKG